MYTLQKLNVVRIVASEHKRDALLSAGFKLVEEKDIPEENTQAEPKAKKAVGKNDKAQEAE